MVAVVEQAVHFTSAGQPALPLEGKLTRPAGDDGKRLHPLAVLCHPQPLSSSMEDGLLVHLAAELAQAGFLALRFNFRGVGASEGEPTDGRFEPLDIAGAVAFLRAQPGAHPEKLSLIGHGFGAWVALVYAAYDPDVRTVVAISLPVFRITPELATFERPRLFVTGEYDEVSPRHKLEPWLEQLSGPRNLRVISGARHLMRGSEAVASATILKYLASWAEMPAV